MADAEDQAKEGRPPIPAETLQQLRNEVGFVCPIRGCTSPYLTWHHFDPPYRESMTHDASGMIALCLEHHKRADHGAFSTAELREYKESGGAPRPTVTGTFDYRLKQFVLFAGGSLFVGTRVILRANGTDLMWLSEDADGRQMLNLDLYGRGGALLLRMRDNAWVVRENLDDIECPPCANSIIIRSKFEVIRLNIKFLRVSRDQLHQLVLKRTRITTLAGAKEGVRYARRAVEHARSGDIPPPPEGWVEETERRAQQDLKEVPLKAQEATEERLKEIAAFYPGEEFVACLLGARFTYPVNTHITDTKMTLLGNQGVKMFGITCIGGEVALDLRA